MPVTIRVFKRNNEYVGYVGNIQYVAPTRQGVVDAWVKDHVYVEDEPEYDITSTLEHVEYILKQRPNESFTSLFNVHPESHEDTFDWNDNEAYFAFIEQRNGITPYAVSAADNQREDLITVLAALDFEKHTSFEVDAYVPDQADAYWILKIGDMYYYIASIYRRDDTDGEGDNYYYEHIKIYSDRMLGAVAHAQDWGEYRYAPLAIKANLTAQLLMRQKIGETNYALTGDEK